MATETDIPTVETKEPVSLTSNLNASLDKLFPEETKSEAMKVEPAKADADEVEEVSTETSKGEDGESASDVDDDTDDDVDDEDDDSDEEFQQAADKHKIPLKLDDLPEETRPFVEKKLKAMEKGYTRAMQDARSYRHEKAQYDAERAYQRDHFDQFLADALVADPSLVEKVNAEIDRRKDPTYATAIAKEREVTQRETELNAKEALAQQEAKNVRGEAIESYTRDAAKEAGIPFALIEPAVVLAITSNPGKEFTEAQVDAIIAQQAEVYKKHVGAVKGAKTREYAKAKADDAKNAGIAKPRSGTGMRTTSTNGAAKPPASLRDFVSGFVDNYSQ